MTNFGGKRSYSHDLKANVRLPRMPHAESAIAMTKRTDLRTIFWLAARLSEPMKHENLIYAQGSPSSTLALLHIDLFRVNPLLNSKAMSILPPHRPWSFI
jgi:hypothetical protein